ncbi:hypothetical protein DTO282F9_7779 [Paecilomyces variotii]|nr:hypothetical protein DTO282F9_7779 [Paecilomyces variotii]
MGKLAKTLPVVGKKAARGDKQQQQPQTSQPAKRLQPSAPRTGKLTRAEKKRKRREELRQQGRVEYRAELASKGIVVPPDMMQPEKPARTLLNSRIAIAQAGARGLTKALGAFEQKLREEEGLYQEIVTELETLS